MVWENHFFSSNHCRCSEGTRCHTGADRLSGGTTISGKKIRSESLTPRSRGDVTKTRILRIRHFPIQIKIAKILRTKDGGCGYVPFANSRSKWNMSNPQTNPQSPHLGASANRRPVGGVGATHSQHPGRAGHVLAEELRSQPVHANRVAVPTTGEGPATRTRAHTRCPHHIPMHSSAWILTPP